MIGSSRPIKTLPKATHYYYREGRGDGLVGYIDNLALQGGHTVADMSFSLLAFLPPEQLLGLCTLRTRGRT